MDKISWRKHHDYLTLVSDHETSTILWGAPGKNATTLDKFFTEIGPKNCRSRAGIDHAGLRAGGDQSSLSEIVAPTLTSGEPAKLPNHPDSLTQLNPRRPATSAACAPEPGWKRKRQPQVPQGDGTVDQLPVRLEDFHAHRTNAPALRPFFNTSYLVGPSRLSEDGSSAMPKKAVDLAKETCPSIPIKLHAVHSSCDGPRCICWAQNVGGESLDPKTFRVGDSPAPYWRR
ncbi:transposase [Paeniglutamicibacter cryotolerans]|uniref:transposase n=1 Tax=Paeniglutamicibacter cryotolerans TaxID=670079 RepID=UPI001620A486